MAVGVRGVREREGGRYEGGRYEGGRGEDHPPGEVFEAWR